MGMSTTTRSLGVAIAALVGGAAAVGATYMFIKAVDSGKSKNLTPDLNPSTTPTGTTTTTPQFPPSTGHTVLDMASKAERLLLDKLTDKYSDRSEAILNALDGSVALRSERDTAIRQTVIEFAFDDGYDLNQIESGLQNLDREWPTISDLDNEFLKARWTTGALHDGALAAAF